MEISRESSFTAYKLTPQEEASGLTFNEANRAVIQNLLSAAAEDFLAVGLQGEGNELILSMDEKLRVAELRGQVNILKYLLRAADVRKEEVEAAETAKQNPPQDQM